MSVLRDDQIALTRQRILDAVIELSTSEGAVPTTVADVARHSGVSPATIYRHFPNRDALVSAAANGLFLQRLAEIDGPVHLASLESYLRALWSELVTELPLVRQSTVTEAGRELRNARYERANRAYRDALASAGRDPDSPDSRHLLAAVQVLGSVHTFLDLVDRQGCSVDEAVDSVLWAVTTLTRSVGLEPEAIQIDLNRIADPAHTEPTTGALT